MGNKQVQLVATYPFELVSRVLQAYLSFPAQTLQARLLVEQLAQPAVQPVGLLQ